MDDRVEALLRQYDVAVGEGAGRPRERILRWTADLQDALVAAAAVAVAGRQHLFHSDNDTRRILFMLEGLLRLYAKRYGKRIERRLVAVKAFEDQLGAVDHAATLLAAACDVRLPKKTIRHLDKELKSARRRLEKILRKRWTLDKAGRASGIAKIIAAVTRKGWDDYDTDRAYLRAELARRLAKVEKTRYDMKDLEEGIHELRRQIRWLPIYLTALDGFVCLDDNRNPVAAYTTLLDSPIATSKYAHLSISDREPSPLKLSRSLFVANTRAIEQLGEHKDRGQLIDGLAAALHESGAAKSRKKGLEKALAALGATREEARGLHERCIEIYAELQHHDLIGALRQGIEKA